MRVEFKLPALGHDLETGDVVTVLVREGDVIAENDSVAEVETEKAVVEIQCSHAGRVTKVHITKGQSVRVGQPVLTLESNVMEKSQPTAAPSESPTAAASPEAKRLANELGVDLASLRGTGKGGRITVDDVRAAAASSADVADSEPPAANEGIPAQRGTREPAVPPGSLTEDDYGPVRRERISPNRQAVSAQMVNSVNTIPHVTNFDDADVTDLERMRKTIPPAYLGPTVKLTAVPFVMKSVAMALRQHPVLNSTLDEKKQEIVHKQYIHIGVQVETPRGLFIPVLRNVDQMSILQIARELTLLGARARSAEFKPEELQGGSFTISNMGTVGGVYSTPIIHHPQVAILLLGRSRWLLGVHEGKIEGRLMMPLSLSYDPRVVDAAVAGRFLNDVIDLLQSPGKLMLTR